MNVRHDGELSSYVTLWNTVETISRIGEPNKEQKAVNTSELLILSMNPTNKTVNM